MILLQQIEIMFKVWKSIFNIANVRNLKIERFKCFLYGRLLSKKTVNQILNFLKIKESEFEKW